MPRYTYNPEKKSMMLQESKKLEMTSEDKALFRSIYESYDPKDIERFLNEDHIASVVNAASSHGQTPGTTERGLKGAINALPSFIVSFLISPAATLLQYFGAAHERAEKRWLKTRINPVRWADFVATPNEKKKEIKDKIEEEMARNVEYYIATLANGEIIRVVGATTLEAREMVETIEQKIYFERGKRIFEDLEKHADDENYKTWRAVFDDGEVSYINGTEQDRMKQLAAAQKDKNETVDAFKSIYKEITHKKLKGTGKDTEIYKYPIKAPKADDMIVLDTQYQAITEENYKNYKIIKADRISGWEASYKKYQIHLGEVDRKFMLNFNLYVANNDDLFKIINNAFNKDEKMKAALETCDNKVREIINAASPDSSTGGEIDYYDVIMSNGDILTLPARKEGDEMIFRGGRTTSDEYRNREQELKNLANGIEEVLYAAINSDDISKETKVYYRKYSGSTRGSAVYQRHTYSNIYPERDFKYVNIVNDTRIIDATIIDSRTKEEEPIRINLQNRDIRMVA